MLNFGIFVMLVLGFIFVGFYSADKARFVKSTTGLVQIIGLLLGVLGTVTVMAGFLYQFARVIVGSVAVKLGMEVPDSSSELGIFFAFPAVQLLFSIWFVMWLAFVRSDFRTNNKEDPQTQIPTPVVTLPEAEAPKQTSTTLVLRNQPKSWFKRTWSNFQISCKKFYNDLDALITRKFLPYLFNKRSSLSTWLSRRGWWSILFVGADFLLAIVRRGGQISANSASTTQINADEVFWQSMFFAVLSTIVIHFGAELTTSLLKKTVQVSQETNPTDLISVVLQSVLQLVPRHEMSDAEAKARGQAHFAEIQVEQAQSRKKLERIQLEIEAQKATAQRNADLRNADHQQKLAMQEADLTNLKARLAAETQINSHKLTEKVTEFTRRREERAKAPNLTQQTQNLQAKLTDFGAEFQRGFSSGFPLGRKGSTKKY